VVQVVLAHHGPALAADVDPLQPLSPAGRAHVERIAAEAARRGVRPETIWHSGKLRARQTAEVWWKACNPFAEMAARRGLQATESARLARAALDAGSRDTLVVGHLPHLSRLLASLLAGADGEPPFPAHGAVALTRTDDGRWVELWRTA
jgi:phosphohistidine phosphatase